MWTISSLSSVNGWIYLLAKHEPSTFSASDRRTLARRVEHSFSDLGLVWARINENYWGVSSNQFRLPGTLSSYLNPSNDFLHILVHNGNTKKTEYSESTSQVHSVWSAWLRAQLSVRLLSQCPTAPLEPTIEPSPDSNKPKVQDSPALGLVSATPAPRRPQQGSWLHERETSAGFLRTALRSVCRMSDRYWQITRKEFDLFLPHSEGFYLALSQGASGNLSRLVTLQCLQGKIPRGGSKDFVRKLTITEIALYRCQRCGVKHFFAWLIAGFLTEWFVQSADRTYLRNIWHKR